MKEKTSVDDIQLLIDDFLEKIRLIDKSGEIREALKMALFGEEISYDGPIKEFPEDTTNEQKVILNKLAKEYLIKPRLTQNNKYQPKKERDIKDVIRKLYEIVPHYTYNNANAFMIMFIETNKEGGVILNYCREIRKDIPQRKNV
jgi:hypothetical protein